MNNIKEYCLNTKNLKDNIDSLQAGDKVLLSGVVFTARDAAHKKIKDLIDTNQPLPFDLTDSVIYYAGPTPAPSNLPIGSCGPTTSSRMDAFAPLLLDNGLLAMIGKGDRSESVYDSIKKNKALYFAALGGGGAIAAKAVVSAEIIAFEELGCEAVRELEIRNFPLILAIDSKGNSIYK